jgi:hypothetical protein
VLLKLQILPGTLEGPALLSGAAGGNIDYLRSETDRTAEAMQYLLSAVSRISSRVLRKIELVDGREKTNRNEFPK